MYSTGEVIESTIPVTSMVKGLIHRGAEGIFLCPVLQTYTGKRSPERIHTCTDVHS